MKKKITNILNKKRKSKIVSLTAYSKNIASILDSQLIDGLNRKRESLFPNHATTPPAKDFITLATKITELKSLNSVL